MQTAFAAFCEQYPQYTETWYLDDLRQRCYEPPASCPHYLDWAGLAPSLGQQHATSADARPPISLKQRLEAFTQRFLRFLGADPREYRLIYTANSRQAMQLWASRFPWGPDTALALSVDCRGYAHNLARQAQSRGAAIEYVPLKPQTCRLDEKQLLDLLNRPEPKSCARLLLLPAQSPFTGVRHCLKLINIAQSLGWQMGLDGESYLATAPLNLSRYHPQFLSLSLGKLFPNCQRLGALIVKREWGEEVGTSTASSDDGGPKEFACPLEEGKAEDLELMASLERGLDLFEEATYGAIGPRTEALILWLSGQMRELRHPQGQARVKLYGAIEDEEAGRFGHESTHAPQVTFNLMDAEGQLLPAPAIAEKLERRGLRLGCGNFDCPALAALVLPPGSRTPAALRASLGLFSTFADVYRLREALAELA